MFLRKEWILTLRTLGTGRGSHSQSTNCAVLETPVEASSATKSHFAVSRKQESFDVSSHIFERIPLEILLYLPFADLHLFARSGRLIHDLSKHPTFWERKILVDMPYLWDIPELDAQDNGIALHSELHRQCLYGFRLKHAYKLLEELHKRDKKTYTYGLAKRRRIWNIRSVITVDYLQASKELSQPDAKTRTRFKTSAVTRELPILPYFDAPLTKRSWCFFLDSLQVLRSPIILTFYFTENDRLGGIGFGSPRLSRERFCGNLYDHDLKNASYKFPPNKWIAGIEMDYCGFDDLTKVDEIGIGGLKVGRFQTVVQSSHWSLKVVWSNGSSELVRRLKNLSVYCQSLKVMS